VESPNEIVARHMQTVPVDLEKIISALGLVLQYDGSLPPSIAGKIMRDTHAHAGFKIVVNSNDNPRRQRFTLAHEIGHYVLHRDLIREDVVDDALYRSSALSEGYERQADQFAGQVLLPAQRVREAWKETKALSVLAQRFNVSDAALRIRLKELGYAA
jgi:predicted transcriptional regulator